MVGRNWSRASRVARLLLAATALATAFVAPAAAVEKADAKLVRRSRAESAQLWRQGWLLPDTALESRLQGLLERMTAGRGRDSMVVLRAHVFRSPAANAFALPDGSVYLCAGLLARLQSWDEVAFILGHESEHALGLHAQRHIASARSTVTILQVLSIAIGANSIGAVIAQLGLELTASAMVNGYGRELEDEADVAGGRELAPAGFDACAGVHALETLLEDERRESSVANFFWGDHNVLRRRIADARSRSGAACPADSSPPPPDYAALQERMAHQSLHMLIDDGSRPTALRMARRALERAPENGENHLLYGDALALLAPPDSAVKGVRPDSLARRRAAWRDTLAIAQGEYRRALELDSALVAAWKGLALTAEARGDTAGAVAALQRYLASGERVPERRAMRRRLELLQGNAPAPAPARTDSVAVPR